MPDQEIRVFVNERGVSVPHGSTALDAVRVLFPDHAVEIEAGEAQLQDSRGLPTDAHSVVTGGSIFRIVPVRHREVPA